MPTIPSNLPPVNRLVPSSQDLHYGDYYNSNRLRDDRLGWMIIRTTDITPEMMDDIRRNPSRYEIAQSLIKDMTIEHFQRRKSEGF